MGVLLAIREFSVGSRRVALADQVEAILQDEVLTMVAHHKRIHHVPAAGALFVRLVGVAIYGLVLLTVLVLEAPDSLCSRSETVLVAE